MQYYYNAESQKYLYWDASQQTYIPVPESSYNTQQESSTPKTPTTTTTTTTTTEVKEKKKKEEDKSKLAKKVSDKKKKNRGKRKKKGHLAFGWPQVTPHSTEIHVNHWILGESDPWFS